MNTDNGDIKPKHNNGDGMKTYRGGVILYGLKKLTEKLYAACADGWFGTALSGYSEENRLLKTGFFAMIFAYVALFFRFLKTKVFGYVSKRIKNSLIVGAVSTLYKLMLRMNLRMFGVFFTTIGVFGIIAKLMVALIGGESVILDDEMIICGIMTSLALPLLFSVQSLGNALLSSRTFRYLFIGFFGFPEEIFTVPKKKSFNFYTGAFVSAILVLALSYMLTALGVFGKFGLADETALFGNFGILSCIAVISAVFALIYLPEAGVLLLILAAPLMLFSDSAEICFTCLISVVAVSYVIKLIRSKRKFRFGLLDAAILFSAVLTRFANVKSAIDSDYNNYVFLLIMSYFLITNLMDTKEWLKRCFTAIVFSSTAVIFASYIVNMIVKSYGNGYIPEILKNSVLIISENEIGGGVLFSFIILILPLLYSASSVGKSGIAKFFVTMDIILIAALLFFRGNLPTLICIGAVTVIYMLFKTKKTLPFIFISVIAFVMIFLVTEQLFADKLTLFGVLSDADSAARTYIASEIKSRLGDDLYIGLGIGKDVYRAVFPELCAIAPGGEMHSFNLFLQILLGYGAVGTVVFAITGLIFFQRCFEYIKKPYNSDSRNVVSAGAVGIIGLLIYGINYYVWYDESVLLLTFLLIGFITTFIKNENKEILRDNETVGYTVTSIE